jgi:hypothetical protein
MSQRSKPKLFKHLFKGFLSPKVIYRHVSQGQAEAMGWSIVNAGRKRLLHATQNETMNKTEAGQPIWFPLFQE